MIRAGDLRETVTLQRNVPGVSEAGHRADDWQTYATGKASLRQFGTVETMRDGMTGTREGATLLIRYILGVSVGDRALIRGVWRIGGILEVGHRKGLELRLVRE